MLKGASGISNIKVVDLGNYCLLGGYLHTMDNLSPIFGVIRNRYEVSGTVLTANTSLLGARCSNISGNIYSTHTLASGFIDIYVYDAQTNKIKFVLGNKSDGTKLKYIVIDLNTYEIGYDYHPTAVWNTVVAPKYVLHMKKKVLYHTYSYALYFDGQNKIPTAYNVDDFKIALDTNDTSAIFIFNTGYKSFELYVHDKANIFRRTRGESTGSLNQKILPTQLIPTGNPDEYKFYFLRIDSNTKTPIFKKGVVKLDGQTNPSFTYTQYTVNDATNSFNFGSILGTGTWYKIIDAIYHKDANGNEYVIALVERRRFNSYDTSSFHGMLIFLIDDNQNTATLVDYVSGIQVISHIPYKLDLTEWIVHDKNTLDFISINFAGQNTKITKSNIVSSVNITSVMIDSLGRIWYVDSTNDEIKIILPTSAVKSEIRLQNPTIEFNGQPIDTNLIVNLYDIHGNRISKTVNLTIVSNNAYFTSNQSKTITITTSAQQDTLVPITITSAGVLNVVLSF